MSKFELIYTSADGKLLVEREYDRVVETTSIEALLDNTPATFASAPDRYHVVQAPVPHWPRICYNILESKDAAIKKADDRAAAHRRIAG